MQTFACFHLAPAGGFHRKTHEPLSGLNLHLKSCFLGRAAGGGDLHRVVPSKQTPCSWSVCRGGHREQSGAQHGPNPANAIWPRSGFPSPPCSWCSSCCLGFQT